MTDTGDAVSYHARSSAGQRRGVAAAGPGPIQGA